MPYGTQLCVSDKPLHGELKLPGMASDFYKTQVASHLKIGVRAMELLREDAAGEDSQPQAAQFRGNRLPLRALIDAGKTARGGTKSLDLFSKTRWKGPHRPDPGRDSLAIRGKNKDTTMSKPMTKTQLVAALAEEMGSDKDRRRRAGRDCRAGCPRDGRGWHGDASGPWQSGLPCAPERQVRNPATGETLTKPADKQVKFTIAKALKDSVNG